MGQQGHDRAHRHEQRERPIRLASLERRGDLEPHLLPGRDLLLPLYPASADVGCDCRLVSPFLGAATSRYPCPAIHLELFAAIARGSERKKALAANRATARFSR